jgi:hydrogenase maturation protease
VIVLDAVQSGASPGTIYRIHANKKSLPPRYFQHSTHAFGVCHAIELAGALQCLPSSLWFFGIEGDSFRYTVGLSPPVQQAVASLASELANQYRHPWRPRLQATAHRS